VWQYAIALRQYTRGIIIEEDHAAAAQAITFELPSHRESAVVGTNIFSRGFNAKVRQWLVPDSLVKQRRRYCAERSDEVSAEAQGAKAEAIQTVSAETVWIASLLPQ
jgi:hypothetical protein